MRKDVTLTKLKIALLLLTGLCIFVATIVVTYAALAHWHVH